MTINPADRDVFELHGYTDREIEAINNLRTPSGELQPDIDWRNEKVKQMLYNHLEWRDSIIHKMMAQGHKRPLRRTIDGIIDAFSKDAQVGVLDFIRMAYAIGTQKADVNFPKPRPRDFESLRRVDDSLHLFKRGKYEGHKRT
jgi:hypothetical protein